MSKMSLYDILSNPSDGEVSSEFEGIDIPLLDYNSSEMMTSDFFDSVFSLEEERNLTNNLSDSMEIIPDGHSNSHIDEVFSPSSFTSDSDKSFQSETSNEFITSSVCDNIKTEYPTIEKGSKGLDIMSFLNTEKIELTEPIQLSSVKQFKPNTKILIQNPHNKKVIVTKKPLMHPSEVKQPIVKAKKVYKVATNNSNCPVLLPLNVKSIKILNPVSLKDNSVVSSTTTQKIVDTVFEEQSDYMEDEVDVVSSTESQYPALNLTLEEKRLLAKEGIKLPSHYPLTKNEERELKRIRRKIRNKISAQDSRKRKKEYVDGLEERVKRSSEEKKYLLQRIKQLQRQNNRLMSHFSKLQALLFKSSTSKANSSTCIMIVLLSVMLVSLPNIRMPKQEMSDVEQGARRALLSSNIDDDLHGLDEFLVFKDDGDALAEDDDNNTFPEKDLSKILETAEGGWKDKEGVFMKLMEHVSQWLHKQVKNEKPVFVEPDIDEDEPPPKRTCVEYTPISLNAAPDPRREVITTTISIPGNKKSK